MTSSDQWTKLKEVFNGALERAARERVAYLDSACAGDTSMRAEIESLLDAYETSDGLSRPLWLDAPPDEPSAPTNIGPYRLIRKLGEGGMGQVWLAEQTSPVERPVALKLIRAGIYDRSVLRRFQSERQSLALMDHPAIAKVFDAGATPSGQPYFVMEYVPGLPITDFCDAKKLKVRERLDLFIQACEGVQHAHQKAIIHRDLKPANILVVEVDGKAMPRIIDFGLAKSTAPALEGDQTLFTQAGVFVGTPGYMSPEQADPGVLDVDTRTDVYSLGVVLYVLLTGSLPFELKQRQPIDEVLRRLREEDPPRPSTKLTAEPANSTSAAAGRGTEPKQLLHEIRGDLDWITMKALERDRNRRYGTPAEFAADLQRFLNHEPVQARPASAGYRLAKYVRRHRVGVAAAGVIVALLAAFGVAQAVQLRRITRERDRANRITDFMAGMFKISDPSESRGNTITAREILDKASADIRSGLAKDPELQAYMMDVMGRVYISLGLYPKAEALLTQAVDIRLRVLGTDNTDTLGSMMKLANVQAEEGKLPQADESYRKILEISHRVLGPTHRRTVAAMNNLALDLQEEGHFEEAEKLTRQVFDIYRRTLGPDDPATLNTASNLAGTLWREKRYAEAATLSRETFESRKRVLGPDHPDTLRSMSNLGITLRDDPGHLPEAEQLLRQVVEAQRRVVGPEHPDVFLSMSGLAQTLTREKKYSEAEKLYRETIQTAGRVLGPDEYETAEFTYDLAATLAVDGKRDDALSTLHHSVDHGLPVWLDSGIEQDPSFDSLRSDPRFAAILADAKRRVAESQQKK